MMYSARLFPKGYFFNAELEIKNNGDTTINNLAIFSELHGGMNCAHNYNYRKFQNLNILPGQIQIVKVRHVYEDGLYNKQICFQCLAPNSKLEKIDSNNSLCKTIDITGVEECKTIKVQGFS